MQRLSLFRALLIFGAFCKARPTPVTGCSVTDKNMLSMGRGGLFEVSVRRMGTAAFVTTNNDASVISRFPQHSLPYCRPSPQ